MIRVVLVAALILLVGAVTFDAVLPPLTDLEPGMVAIPEPSARAVEFQRTGVWLWCVGRVWALAIPAAILFSGWAGRIGRFAEANGRPRVIAMAIFASTYLLIEFAAKLPLRFWAGFVRLHDYGLSTQSFGHWLGDEGKRLAVEVVAAALFAWVPYALMTWSPRRWWLWTGLLILPFSAGSALVAPVVVDPLFNSFGPMHNQRVEAQIKNLAERAGIKGSQIFEVNKSRETTTVNAYVTGLFGTKRIVLWDTIIARLNTDELLVVMGHEMGHYALNHVALGITLGSLATLVGLYLIQDLAAALIRRFSGRFGFDRIERVASIPLLLLLVEGMILLTSPLSNAASRWMEHEADRFALELTHANHAAATGFVKLQRDNLAIPFPDLFTRVWRSTHPTLRERITFCNHYRPWATGRPSRYADWFAPR